MNMSDIGELLCLVIVILLVWAIATFIFLFVLWLIDKYLLHGKFKMKYRVLVSIALPVLIVVAFVLDIRYGPYCESRLNKRLLADGIEMKLPPYKIVDYKDGVIASAPMVWGDDAYELYEIVLKDDRITELVPMMDSLCTSPIKFIRIDDPDSYQGWSKENDCYKYSSVDFRQETRVELTICPKEGTAEYYCLNW